MTAPNPSSLELLMITPLRSLAHRGPSLPFRRTMGILVATLVLAVNSAVLLANSADFDGDGKADLLFMNKTTRFLSVWFMNGSTFVRSRFITASRSPIAVDPNWKVVGVGKFDASNTNRLAIVWQNTNPTTRQLAVWYLKDYATNITDKTELDTTSLIPNNSNPYLPAEWSAMAVGDFDGNGKSDIAFRHDTAGLAAIWLMNGLTITANTSFINNINWRITGAGDFGSPAQPNAGQKDGKDDMLLTFHNPATDNAYEGLNNIVTVRRCRLTPSGASVAGWPGETTII
jgi:hypothetical protein